MLDTIFFNFLAVSQKHSRGTGVVRLLGVEEYLVLPLQISPGVSVLNRQGVSPMPLAPHMGLIHGLHKYKRYTYVLSALIVSLVKLQEPGDSCMFFLNGFRKYSMTFPHHMYSSCEGFCQSSDVSC